MVECTLRFSSGQANLQSNPISQKKQVGAASGPPGISSAFQTKIGETNWEVVRARLLGVASGFVLVGILAVGLWPFHSPKNQVTWLAGGNGLHFGRRGTILSSDNFKATNALEGGPCSIEIWLVPDFTASSGGTLLAFYAPRSPRHFSLQQSITDLDVRIDIREGRYRTRIARFYVADIFRRGSRCSLRSRQTEGGHRSILTANWSKQPLNLGFPRGILKANSLPQTGPEQIRTGQGFCGALPFITKISLRPRSFTTMKRGQKMDGQKFPTLSVP